MDTYFDISVQTKPKRFVYVVVTSVLMYRCRRSWHEWMKKPTLAAFLKHNAEWDAGWSLNLYFSKVSWMQLFPQNGSYSNAQPPLMWHKKVYAAMSNLGWWKWNDSIRPVILCPCALNNSIFQSLQRLVDNICSRYGLLTAFTEHYPHSDVVV